MMTRTLFSLLLSAMLSAGVGAVETASTQIGRTQLNPGMPMPSEQQAHDLALAQIWGLSVEEIQRARHLSQQGTPRAAFSASNISPIEVLGIHAATAAERQRYATLFAKALRADTERVLAWTVTYGQVAKRLYPNEKIFDFGNSRLPKNQEIYLR